MKVLEYFGYIHLPDDFEGDDIDALEWYLKDRRERDSKGKAKRMHGEGPKWGEPIYKHMQYLYKMMVEHKKTRAGVFTIKEFKNGEWENTEY